MGSGREPLRFELPYSADAPQLVAPDLGFAKMARRGNGSYTMDVTVLDTPDNRLLRAGVVLAHRISDGIGGWYLAAPEWPTLPPEQIEPMSAAAELPPQFSKWIQPLTRGLMVGPVAGLSTERAEYWLRDEENNHLVNIRDDSATVRRGGLIVNRYREVSIFEAQPLSEAQWNWLATAMAEASATQLDKFPRLQERIGAPATGLSDFPDPEPLHKSMTLDRYVRRLFTVALQEVVSADLALISGLAPAEDLVAALHKTSITVTGLASVLEPKWRARLEADLAELESIGQEILASGLQNPDLLEVIGALVSAARAPRLGDLSGSDADEVFTRRVRAGTVILFDRCRSLTPDSPQESWVAAQRAAEQLRSAVQVAADLRPRVAKPFRKYLKRLIKQLRACAVLVSEPTEAEVAKLTPLDAYAAGLAVAAGRASVLAARRSFVERWPVDLAKMRKLVRSR